MFPILMMSITLKCGFFCNHEGSKSLESAFARLSHRVVGSVRAMEIKPVKTTEIRDQIDAQVTHIIAWTTLLGALEQKTPETLEIPNSTMGEVALSLGDTATLVGYGRSYGYTTGASLTDRRVGFNVIDEFEAEASSGGILFRYDFEDPDSSGSLGNDLETLVGPGDSGGSLLVGNALVGVNTFTEGYGGLFGDIGGGIALNDEWDWIHATLAWRSPNLPAHCCWCLGWVCLFSSAVDSGDLVDPDLYLDSFRYGPRSTR